MIQSRNLSRAISDSGWGEFVRQLTYKAAWYGATLIKAEQKFPSSKTCSKCKHKKDKLSLSDRVFECEKCGFKVDRDVNAAINLAQYNTEKATSNAEGSHACGEDGSAVDAVLIDTQPASLNQEGVSLAPAFGQNHSDQTNPTNGA
jgi:putative transposase